MAKPIKIQDLSRTFIEENPNFTFVIEYGCFYDKDPIYNYYKPIIDHELAIKLTNFLDINLNINITEATVKAFTHHIKINCRQQQSPDTDKILFNDQFYLDLTDLTIKPLQEEDIITFFINTPTPKDGDACNIFHKTLTEILVKKDKPTEPDQELINLTQEMFGYYLLSELEPPVAFFLNGQGSNGKSTLLQILEQLAGGEKFVMANSIENITTSQWAAQQLRFHRLNCCSEEQSKRIKTDKLKAIIDGSKIYADIKFSSPISFNPKTKHIFATNSLPSFDKIDDGLKRRIIIIPFYRKFEPQDSNKQLKTADFTKSLFHPELSAIVAWAIQGAQRLRSNNYVFSYSEASQEQMSTYIQNSSNAVAFIQENFTTPPKQVIVDEWNFFSVERLYKIYQVWCKSNGKKTFASNNFREEIQNTLKLKSVPAWDKVEKRTFRGFYLNLQDECSLKNHPDLLMQFDESETVLPLTF